MKNKNFKVQLSAVYETISNSSNLAFIVYDLSETKLDPSSISAFCSLLSTLSLSLLSIVTYTIRQFEMLSLSNTIFCFNSKIT